MAKTKDKKPIVCVIDNKSKRGFGYKIKYKASCADRCERCQTCKADVIYQEIWSHYIVDVEIDCIHHLKIATAKQIMDRFLQSRKIADKNDYCDDGYYYQTVVDDMFLESGCMPCDAIEGNPFEKDEVKKLFETIPTWDVLPLHERFEE